MPRPRVETVTTRRTAWAVSAFVSGVAKASKCARYVGADGAGGTSQNTWSAPLNARSRTSGSACEPGTTSTAPRTAGVRRPGSRAIAKLEREMDRVRAPGRDLAQFLALIALGDLFTLFPASVATRYPRRPVTDAPPSALAVAWPERSRSTAVAALVRAASAVAEESRTPAVT